MKPTDNFKQENALFYNSILLTFLIFTYNGGSGTVFGSTSTTDSGSNIVFFSSAFSFTIPDVIFGVFRQWIILFRKRDKIKTIHDNFQFFKRLTSTVAAICTEFKCVRLMFGSSYFQHFTIGNITFLQVLLTFHEKKTSLVQDSRIKSELDFISVFLDTYLMQ